MTTSFWIAYGLLWTLVVIEGAAIFALYNHIAQAYLSSRNGRDKQGPAIGSAFAELHLRDVNGVGCTIPEQGRSTLLIFASTTCPICASLRSDIVAFSRAHEDFVIAVVCEGHIEEVRTWANVFHHRIRVIPDRSFRTPSKLDIGMTPFVVGIDSGGVVKVKGLVNEGAGLEWAARETAWPAIDMEQRIRVAQPHV
jgi:hypothetical protein